MTEYWKSNPRKFCDFCKCWLADNKVSISFHESGKRHKENVQKHISTLSKKSAKDFKAQEKIDDEMKKMEAAAMAAYLKDVQNNADLTSQSINQMLAESEDASTRVTLGNTKKEKDVLLWHELKSEDGNLYYWNTVTNETVWEPPAEYLSLAEQEKQKKEKEKAKDWKSKQEQKQKNEEVKAFHLREKMRGRAATGAPGEGSAGTAGREGATVVMGPAPRAPHPLGSWSAVEPPKEAVDLQLPQSSRVVLPPPVPVEPEPEPVFQFKEKKAASLGEGPVEFKKRKLNSNMKRNIRQKLDDD